LVTNSTTWKSFASNSRTATANEINEIRDSATVKCIFEGQYPVSDCNPSVTKQPCLFNVVLDPCETHNLVNTKETIMRMLYNILTTKKQSLLPDSCQPLDYDGANPAKFNQTWSPWQDWQHTQDICLALVYTLNSSLMMKCVMVVPQTNISEIYSAYINRVDFISSSTMVLNTRKKFQWIYLPWNLKFLLYRTAAN